MLASGWLSNLQHLQPAVHWKSGSLSRLKSKVEQMIPGVGLLTHTHLSLYLCGSFPFPFFILRWYLPSYTIILRLKLIETSLPFEILIKTLFINLFSSRELLADPHCVSYVWVYDLFMYEILGFTILVGTFGPGHLIRSPNHFLHWVLQINKCGWIDG